jgi:hypothetical protein
VETATRRRRAGWAGALGALGAVAVLAAGGLLASQVSSPLFLQAGCSNLVPPGDLPACLDDDRVTAQWWLAYGVLFPGFWRTLGFLGLSWLGAGAVGFVAAGLAVRGSVPGVAVVLHLVAAVGAGVALAVVAAIVRETAPRDAPAEVGEAALLALVGIVCLALAGWLIWRARPRPAATDGGRGAV